MVDRAAAGGGRRPSGRAAKRPARMAPTELTRSATNDRQGRLDPDDRFLPEAQAEGPAKPTPLAAPKVAPRKRRQSHLMDSYFGVGVRPAKAPLEHKA